jgi:alkylhydroperoxidase family enzyme
LLRAWATLRQHVVIDSALTEQQKEIVILRTGHRWGSEYEWAHHVFRGHKIGLSEERIARTAMPIEAGAEVADDEDAALLQATDALLDNGRLNAETRQRLTTFLSDAAIIDIMATIGMYTTLAFLVNSFGTPIDEDVLRALNDADR